MPLKKMSMRKRRRIKSAFANESFIQQVNWRSVTNYIANRSRRYFLLVVALGCVLAGCIFVFQRISLNRLNEIQEHLDRAEKKGLEPVYQVLQEHQRWVQNFWWMELTLVMFLLGAIVFVVRTLLLEVLQFANLKQSHDHELQQVIRAIEQSAIVSVTDINGRITSVNNEFCRISGYSSEELIGRDHRIINSGLESKAYIKNLWSTILSGKVWSGEIRNRAKDGHIYVVKSVITPVRNSEGLIDRFFSIRFDLSEQKKLQHQLEEAQAIAKLGNWTVDLKTNRCEWSKQMYQFFPELTGDSGPSLETHRTAIHQEDLSIWDVAVQNCVRDGTPFKIRFRSVLPDNNNSIYTADQGATEGETEAWFGQATQDDRRSKDESPNKDVSRNKWWHKEIWIESLGYGIKDSSGEVIAMAGTYQDVTEKVITEMTIEQQRLRNIHTEKLVALGEMSAGVAHEINNPLAIINGNILLLRKFREDEVKFDAKMEIIEKAILRISKIVRSLRKFARAPDAVSMEPHSFGEIVREALAITEPKSRSRFTPIEVSIESDADILCDNIEIEQVIINLINNAIDAVQTLSEKWVKIRVFEDGLELVLQVTDSGSGISPEIEAKIFQPFFTTKPVGEGTGLGLSICIGILSHHNAKFSLNRQNIHTCFEARFPVLQDREKKHAS